MQRVLVTGAAGFVGSHLLERLLRTGSEVVAVDDFDDYYDPLCKRANLAGVAKHPRLRLVERDLLTLLPSDLDGVDAIFHLAGQPGVRSSWGDGFERYLRNNVAATQHLLELVRAQPVAKIVYASSSSVYGTVGLPQREDGPTRPHSPYGVTKLAAENLCSLYAHNDGVPVVSTRFFTVYGPRQRPDMAFDRFLRAIAAGMPITVFGDGSQTRDFTFVDDIVEGMLLAAERGRDGEVYNLGGGTQIPLIEAIETMARTVGRSARIEFRASERGDVDSTRASTEKARAELGYVPKVALADGIARHAAALGARVPRTARVPRRRRVAMYSHDTYGLGHMRRNLAIAQRLLAGDEPCDVLLISGSPVIEDWSLPNGLLLRALPAVVKVGAEQYVPRDPSVDSATLFARRRSAIEEALGTFAPDVFVVDHAPVGMKSELRPLLASVRSAHPALRTVLGLRDILDDPAVVRAQWTSDGIFDVIDRCYDRVLVYGSPEIASPVQAYGIPPGIAAKTIFCGYVVREPKMRAVPRRNGEPLRVLATAGGGGDGFGLLSDTVLALEGLPPGTARATLLAGPLMSAADAGALHRLAAKTGEHEVVSTTQDSEQLIADADLVIAMGGYNTIAEILAARVPALVVPRTTPRIEQKLRADALAERGVVWTAAGGDAVAQISRRLQDVAAGIRPPHIDDHAIDLGGAAAAAAAIARVGMEPPLAAARTAR